MTKPKVKTQFEVGAWYTDDGVNIWKCIEYTPEPHVTLSPIQEGETIDGLVSKFTSFVRMVPEVDPPARPKRKYERKQPWPEIPNGEGIIKEKSDGNVS